MPTHATRCALLVRAELCTSGPLLPPGASLRACARPSVRSSSDSDWDIMGTGNLVTGRLLDEDEGPAAGAAAAKPCACADNDPWVDAIRAKLDEGSGLAGASAPQQPEPPLPPPRPDTRCSAAALAAQAAAQACLPKAGTRL